MMFKYRTRYYREIFPFGVIVTFTLTGECTRADFNRLELFM